MSMYERATAGTHSRVEEELICLSAGTAARREATAGYAERLSRLADWSRVTETLRARRVLPTLGPRIVELAHGGASDDFVEAVERAIEVGRRQGAFLALIAERVVAMLVEDGIACTVLKGPFLSESLYCDPGRRPSGDIDLLVAQEHLQPAVEVVRELDYEAPRDYVDRQGLPLLHFALIHRRGELPPIELHWRIHWYERCFAREQLLPSTPVRSGKEHAAPINELVALLLFYARDGFIDLRHATDLAAWWDAYGETLRAGALEEPIHRYPELAHVLTVAARVAEKTVGLPLAKLVDRDSEPSRRERIAVRLADTGPRPSHAQLYADIGLIDGLLTPRGGFLAFVKRQVIPPREVLRERALRTQDHRASSPLGHGLRVLGRYALAIGRLLRAPQARPSV